MFLCQYSNMTRWKYSSNIELFAREREGPRDQVAYLIYPSPIPNLFPEYLPFMTQDIFLYHFSAYYSQILFNKYATTILIFRPVLLSLKNVTFREPFVERCRDCGRDVRCVRQKNAGEITFAVINRVSYATGSYKRSEVLVNFDTLQVVSGILHLREIFLFYF